MDNPAIFTIHGDSTEPPIGSVIEICDGSRWTRVFGNYGDTDWVHDDNPDADPESWVKLAGNYGPVKVLSVGGLA